MVILSVAVLNKKGKTLVARQYVPMSRLRIEGLLTAFPKLINNDDNSTNKQHTFIETDEVRYIYQPMDTLYLLLITNMQSNIIEDLNTLRTVAKLVPEYCQGHDEEAVQKNGFELVFAMDEVITPMGYREQVTFQQIEQFTEMDSAEEKLNQIIEDSKIHNQQEFLKKKQKEFDKQRRKEYEQRTGRKSFPGSEYLDSLNIGISGFGSNKGISSDNVKKTGDPKVTITTHGFGSDSNYNNNDNTNNDNNNNNLDDDNDKHMSSKYSQPKQKKKNTGPRQGGMVLGGGKKKADKLLRDANELDSKSLNKDIFNLMDTTRNIVEKNENDGPMTNVELYVNEKLSIRLDRDGGLLGYEIKGDIEICINEVDNNTAAIYTTVNPSKKTINGDKVTWRLHPKMNSSLWKKGILTLKDLNKPFRVGRNYKTSILKWRLLSKNEDNIPIKFEFWIENENNKVSCNCQYNVENEDVSLKNVIVTIPITQNTNKDIEIENIDGNFNIDKRNNEIQWILGDINTEDNPSGEFLFKLEGLDVDDLYPINVNFDMLNNYTPIDILKVTNPEDEEDEYEYEKIVLCHADKYSFGEE